MWLQEIHVQMKEIRVKMKEIRVQMKEIHVQMKEIHVQMKEIRVQMKEIRVQRREIHVQMREIHVQMKESRVQMREIHVQMKEGRVQMDILHRQSLKCHSTPYVNVYFLLIMIGTFGTIATIVCPGFGLIIGLTRSYRKPDLYKLYGPLGEESGFRPFRAIIKGSFVTGRCPVLL